MAIIYIDPSVPVNGSGTEESPYNTFVGITWGSNNSYLLKRGTVLYETITPASGANIIFSDYGDLNLGLPIIDCANTRAIGLNLNSRVACTVTNLHFKNQIGNPANGGIAVTGSKHIIKNCRFSQCQVSIHVNASADNLIQDNYFDIGNPQQTPTSSAYGVRVNAASSARNRIIFNTLRSTTRVNFISSLELYGATSCVLGWNDVMVPYADGPALRMNTTGSYLIGNYVRGKNVLDGLVVEGSNSNFIYNNTVIHLGDTEGHTGPAFKMGNEFGGADPSDLNIIKNNIFVSYTNLTFAGSIIGTGNLFNNNCYYRATTTGASPTIITYNTGGGAVQHTLATWQALGYDANSFNAKPDILISGLPKQSSFLIGTGSFVGQYVDPTRKYYANPPSIGAFEAATERATAPTRGTR